MCNVGPSLSDVEQKLQEAQKSMAEALEDFEKNETAKFHQIYESLQDLCTKQFKLEENVAAIESEMRTAFMTQMVPMVMCPQLMSQMPLMGMNVPMGGMQMIGMNGGTVIPAFPTSPGGTAESAIAFNKLSNGTEVHTERTERTESTEAETPSSTAMKDVSFEKEMKESGPNEEKVTNE
ncbi:unnamed protein product [Durusdinium trenchii]|uniref:Uncharacterized protein n=1 Tax=Durusdinium trenchii TaxID=1381693 RepID=A0ABP0IUJ8_9DINO